MSNQYKAIFPTTPVFYINISSIEIVEKREERTDNNNLDKINTGQTKLFFCMLWFAFFGIDHAQNTIGVYH